LPAPHLTLDRVTIGKLQVIKVDSIHLPVGPLGLISGVRRFDTIDAKGVTAESDALAAVGGWLRAPASAPEVQVARVKISAIKVAAPGVEIPPFDVDATLGSRGEVSKATITMEKARLELTPTDKAWQMSLSATAWKPFIAPALEFDELEASGVIDGAGNQALINTIKGRVAGGSVSGQLKASWGGAIQASGDLKLENARVNQVLPAFTRNFSASGTLNMSGNYALSAPTMQTLFQSSRLEGAFTITGGELNNVDLVRAMQSNRPGGQRGGKTRFDTLSGTLQIGGNQYGYRQLQLGSGPMNANGSVYVSNGALSGQVNTELGNKGIVAARATLAVSGKLEDPVLK
jgi:hypothetical protein